MGLQQQGQLNAGASGFRDSAGMVWSDEAAPGLAGRHVTVAGLDRVLSGMNYALDDQRVIPRRESRMARMGRLCSSTVADAVGLTSVVFKMHVVDCVVPRCASEAECAEMERRERGEAHS